jgi:hypothetical protein
MRAHGRREMMKEDRRDGLTDGIIIDPVDPGLTSAVIGQADQDRMSVVIVVPVLSAVTKENFIRWLDNSDAKISRRSRTADKHLLH